LQHKASSFGIKQNGGTQINSALALLNIILANKKHLLQRKYMELIREKD
jgi:hypothetical protein